MDTTEFINKLSDLLQRDEPLEPDMILRDLPEWDSLAMLSIAGFFDAHLRRQLGFGDFAAMVTVADLMKAAGVE